MRVVLLIGAAFGCYRSPPPPPAAPLAHRPPAQQRALPDDACLRLGTERNPAALPHSGAGRCRLRDELHPPTGRICIASLRALGAAELTLTGCYREQGSRWTLDHASLDRNEVEMVFEFDGRQCWIIGKQAWSDVSASVKAFLARTTGCSRIRDDYEL